MDQNVYLIIIAIAVVGLDIALRIFVHPRRRDRFYQALVEMQTGVAARERRGKTASAFRDESLAEALLSYFHQSFTSRQVMAALAASNDGMDGKELEQQIAEHVSQRWNRDLPTNVIRRVIMILMGANLVSLRNDKFALTDVGWTVFRKTKNPMGPRWNEAARASLVAAQ